MHLAVANEKPSRETAGQVYALARLQPALPEEFSLDIDVRRACKLRSLRRRLLGEDYFTGPAWGILLHLFDAHLRQTRDTIGSLGAATDIPMTTVLRWVERLENRQLIASRADPVDARRRFVELTPAAVDLMTRYFKGAATHLLAA